MTLHVEYNHQCASCGAYYIPYDENVPWPNCGLLEDDRFDYIPKAIESILFNLEVFGSYLPPLWFISSLGDYILVILFDVFEHFSKSKETDFHTFVKSILSKMEWTKRKYLEKHVHSIALRIHEEIKKKKSNRQQRITERIWVRCFAPSPKFLAPPGTSNSRRMLCDNA